MIELGLGKRSTSFWEDGNKDNEKCIRLRLDNSNKRNMHRPGCFGGKK